MDMAPQCTIDHKGREERARINAEGITNSRWRGDDADGFESTTQEELGKQFRNAISRLDTYAVETTAKPF